jgi:hypothetical protein
LLPFSSIDCPRVGYRGEYWGLTEGEVTGDWRKLHNEELYDLHSSPNIIFSPMAQQPPVGQGLLFVEAS